MISSGSQWDLNHRALYLTPAHFFRWGAVKISWSKSRSGLSCSLCSDSRRLIRRTELLILILTGYGIQTYTCKTKSCPANICNMYGLLPLSAVTYWIKHAQYFTLINLRLKLQFCAKTSWELPINLLGWDSAASCGWRELNIPGADNVQVGR